VRRSMGRDVIITSRSAANAMLVAESSLESVAKRLHDIEAGHGLPAESFKLVGSGRITAGIEDPVVQIRQEANAASPFEVM
jgi:hypothetical protein